MKMRCLLVGIIVTGLSMLTPDAVAHGGAGGGTGHGGGRSAGHGGGSRVGRGGGAWGGHGQGAWGGRSGGSWTGHGGGPRGGHGHFAWGGHGHGFHHNGRFIGPGFGFFGYGYPWYGYPYYPYSAPYYGDPYYDSGYYGDTYYGNQYYERPDPRFSAIKSLQTALARRGYYRGPIDGVFGPETRDAVRSFQAHQGLPVTGQVDSRLIRALQS
jgi:hypothetical protein